MQKADHLKHGHPQGAPGRGQYFLHSRENRTGVIHPREVQATPAAIPHPRGQVAEATPPRAVRAPQDHSTQAAAADPHDLQALPGAAVAAAAHQEAAAEDNTLNIHPGHNGDPVPIT